MYSEEESFSSDGESLQFGSPDYWNERYQKQPDEYEWFASWNEIKAKLNYGFECGDKALNLGCGNSPLFIQIENMFNEIHNIDISGVVIEQMKNKYADNKKQFW